MPESNFQFKGHPTLVVKCNRPDFGTNYAHFVAGYYDGVMFDPLPCRCTKINAIRITFLHVKSSGVVYAQDSEILRYADYEEAAQLYDGIGWNADDVSAFMRGMEFAGQQGQERA